MFEAIDFHHALNIQIEGAKTNSRVAGRVEGEPVSGFDRWGCGEGKKVSWFVNGICKWVQMQDLFRQSGQDVDAVAGGFSM